MRPRTSGLALAARPLRSDPGSKRSAGHSTRANGSGAERPPGRSRSLTTPVPDRDATMATVVIDTLDHASRYSVLHPLFGRAFEFVATTPLLTLLPGRIPLDGDRLVVSIDHIDGRGRQGCAPGGPPALYRYPGHDRGYRAHRMATADTLPHSRRRRLPPIAMSVSLPTSRIPGSSSPNGTSPSSFRTTRMRRLAEKVR